MAERFRLTVNGTESELEADANTPLLYALRNDLELKGTRFGCGSGQCGACFVLIDGHPAPACDTPLWALDAALLARAAGGLPVQVQWMRDDEFAWAPCGPAMALSLTAALDAKGNIVDWQHELWSNGHSSRPGRSENPALLASWHFARPCERPSALNMPLPAGAADRNAIPIYDFPNQRVVNQIEGGAIQSTSWTLKEQLKLEAHGIASLGWEEYPILKFSEVPAVEIELIDRPELPAVGAGEAAQGPTGAAIANAVAQALGLRIRELPLTSELIIAAIERQ